MSISLSTLVFNVTSNTSALTYQNTIEQTFTINETLSISLSSADLRIDQLIPGQSSDSNTITVTVLSNNAYGYNLSANTGNTTYNTTNLVNKAGATNVFSSLSTEDSKDTPSSFNDNTWGFNYCDYNNTPSCNNNWNTYSGLPLYTAGANKELKNTETVSAATGDKLDFKIAAKASTSQTGGEYNNVVNFIAISNPKPPLYMQDVDQIKTKLANKPIGTELEVTDKRDNKTYAVAKMADGNIWMNQNLDFDIDSTKTYTPADTDIPANWTPSTSTTTTNTWSTDASYYNLPQSYDPGDLCWKGIPSTSNYGSLSQYAQACSTAGSNPHYHVGNYYDWTAAVAMNDSSSHTSQNDDVNQSICPAGWMLPKSGTTQTGSGSFQYLVNQQGLTSGTSGNIHQTPVYFVYSGGWNGSSYNVSYLGIYWSSVVDSSSTAYSLNFNANGYLNPQYNASRVSGRLIRCVARP